MVMEQLKNSKWITDLDGKRKTIKFLKDYGRKSS